MNAGKDQPFVSVIVPTYERLDYLRTALASALAQTYPNVEIIVSDNGPSAAVAELVAACGDSRLRYRHNGKQFNSTCKSKSYLQI